MSNIEAYEAYKNKCRILGINEELWCTINKKHDDVSLDSVKFNAEYIQYKMPDFITDVNMPFENCSYIPKLIWSNPPQHLDSLFESSRANSIDTSAINFTNVKSIESLFKHCYNLSSISIDISKSKYINNLKSLFAYCTNLKYASITSNNNIINLDELCFNCVELETISLDMLDSTNVDSMIASFYECKNLKYIHGLLKSNKLSNITYVFNNCKNLEPCKFIDKLIKNIDSHTLVKNAFKNSTNILKDNNIYNLLNYYEAIF